MRGERAVESWFLPADGDEPLRLHPRARRPATPRDPPRARHRPRGCPSHGAARRPDDCHRTLACAGWCPTSSSCGRSSRTTAASCCSSFRASQPSSSATRLPSRTPSGHCCSTTRSSFNAVSRREWSFAEPLSRFHSARPAPPAAAGSSCCQGEPRTRRRSQVSRPVRALATYTARCGVRRSRDCSGRRSRRRDRRSSCASTAAASTTRTRSCAVSMRGSSGSCARSSTPRSGAPEHVSSAPAERPPPATRSDYARSTTRSAPPSTRPGAQALHAAARRQGSRRSRKGSAATPFRPSRPRRALLR